MFTQLSVAQTEVVDENGFFLGAVALGSEP